MKSQSSEIPSSVSGPQPVAELLSATAMAEVPDALARARAFAEPLISTQTLDTGENILAHAQAVAEILRMIGGSEAMQAPLEPQRLDVFPR